MAWFLIAMLMILLWVVSLCKVLHASSSASKVASFLDAGGFTQKKNILLVIAHPDDESMFFCPTILYFMSRGYNFHILCMSTGNADGKGNIRKEELYQACLVLKIPRHQVKIIDHPDLQDGFEVMWSHSLLSSIIQDEIANQNIDLLITFDNYGVSGHRNHRDVHHGVCRTLYERPHRDIEAWELLSTSIIRKYSGPVDLWLSVLYAHYYQRGQMHCLLNENPCKSFLVMSQHESQWIWFRKLFVSFSSYTYVNTLRKMII
ncbi:PREDICTED: N-acetylglucosaminyl-phosphatidylinositol de-N-acetylase isoform X1 [Nelumbo nucifera]|uniref:N-acetylglucosaminylphosphatidylinositol deacetylase n=1 Tax=Nelumbo nucifera TaxID=4432 RepID=A0A1U8BF11_NELNU|nr:PREDICTED: N-acetylglucosaminyl-phosphatidylinositol de-N-acetylase isoform X1 [Nelumbo nucifera]XP_010275007.1 PREDICTED: N-acetylglucosaminyl-phosphatidylinositol de-N-acetylase isoform X1 [Nelumbo nucifera]